MDKSLPPTKNDLNSCSYLSTQAGEALFATATQNQVWLLLEVPPPWESKAFKASHLPDPVKQYLSSLLDTIPSSRLQFIYRNAPAASNQISFFIGSSAEVEPYLLEFRIGSYDDVLDLEIASILNGNLPRREFIRRESLFMVCTNGRRDPCCSRLGLPVYRQLRKLAPNQTWQTIHVGGHRFAANVVWLPHGLYFGRLSGLNIQPLMDSIKNNQIYLPNFRGRSSYPPPAQAADYYLRLQTGSTDVNAFHLSACEKTGENLWRINMSSTTSGDKYMLEIGEHISPFATLQSCRDTEPAPVTLFRLESIHQFNKENA